MSETIHKAKGLESEFVILRNKEAQRKDLTYAAVGMLVYLMSLPPDWKIYVDELKREGAGRDKVRALLAELEAAGFIYIERGANQPRNDGGMFATNEYHAYAMPEYNPHFKPLPENPLTVNPLTDSPSTAKPPLQRKEIKKKTSNKNNTGAGVVSDEKLLQEQDNAIGRIARFYESNFFMLTPHTKDTLKEQLETYGEAMLMSALKIAVEAGKRNLRYVDGVLKRMVADGVDTSRGESTQTESGNETVAPPLKRMFTDEQVQSIRGSRNGKTEQK